MLCQQLELTANYNKMDNKTLGKIPGKQIHQKQGLKDFLEGEGGGGKASSNKTQYFGDRIQMFYHICPNQIAGNHSQYSLIFLDSSLKERVRRAPCACPIWKQWTRAQNSRIIEYPKLKGTFKVLAPHKTTQKSDHVSKSVVQHGRSKSERSLPRSAPGNKRQSRPPRQKTMQPQCWIQRDIWK